MVFEKLESNTLRLRIADKFREAILNGSLTEGERIVERKLATLFGSSLTAVREALIQLESEGLVTKKPNAATFVIKLTPEEIEQIFRLREVLEGFAVEEACRLASDEQLVHLEQLYRQMEDAVRAMDIGLLLQTDFSWHEAIWRTSDNEFLQAALRRIFLPLRGLTSIRISSHSSEDLMRDAVSHLPLLKALQSRDAEAARKALDEGLDAWYAATRAYVFRERETKQAKEA